MESHLLQMRGLKQILPQPTLLHDTSHLLQMRGLKPKVRRRTRQGEGVASFTDAWIETPIRSIVPKRAVSHLLQMRGLKQNQLYTHCRPHQSHLLQMRGLKPFYW